MIRDGMKSIAKLGVCTEDTWPYDIPRFTEKPPQKAYTEAKKHQALVYRRVLGQPAPDAGLPRVRATRSCSASRCTRAS